MKDLRDLKVVQRGEYREEDVRDVDVGVVLRRCKATWKRGFKLPWREAGPPNHHDDKVDSDQ